MPGHLQKKGNRYYAVIETRDPATGKRSQRWIATGCTTEREAKPVLNKLLHEVETGQYIEPSKMTVAGYLDQWLDVKRPTSTVYRRNIDKHIVPALGAIQLQKLKPLQVQRYYSTKASELSPATIALHHSILNAAFKQAVKWELVTRNPMEAVTPPKVEKTPPKIWSEDEQTRFLESAKGDLFYAAYCIGLVTGLRRGEIIALKWDDIDLAKSTISVSRTTTKDGSEVVTREPKTKASRRTLKIPGELLSLLKVHRAQCKLAVPGYDATGLVFTAADASPVKPDNIRSAFLRAIDRAGVPKIRFHAMRHTYATTMLRNRIPLPTVSEMLGHTSVKITGDIYSHVTTEMQEEAAQTAGSILRANKNQKRHTL